MLTTGANFILKKYSSFLEAQYASNIMEFNNTVVLIESIPSTVVM